MISVAQMKMARSLLDWTQKDLAEATGVSEPTIRNIEKGASAKINTLNTIQAAFVTSGVNFLPNDGVARASANVKTLEGHDGFWKFYDDVYETLKSGAGEIFVSNVDEKEFDKWFHGKGMAHKTRMAALAKEKEFKISILIKEGDYHFTVPEYAEYRWTPADRFSEIPFYVYGNKLAIILFEENNVSIFIIEQPKIAKAYKSQFNVMWEQAIRIPKDKVVTAKGLELDE